MGQSEVRTAALPWAMPIRGGAHSEADGGTPGAALAYLALRAAVHACGWVRLVSEMDTRMDTEQTDKQWVDTSPFGEK